jgi:peptide/nickel transport system substrate-binding protein
MNLKLALSGAALLASLVFAPVQAATLRWAAQNDILTLDPHSQNHATTNAILQHAYEGLTRYNTKYEPEPALATKWTAISPTQMRFELRKGVKFQDGSPFTADDVIFSFGRIKQPQGTMAIYVAGIADIKKVDDHTVDFMLAGPNPLLLRNIADFFIMSKTWSEKNKTTNVQDYKAKEENFASRNVNGTGSYKITGWTPDQRVTMTANPDWWDKANASNVTEVIYTPIKSDSTRVAALLSGDVDMVTDLPTQDVARLRGDAKLKVLDGNEVRTIFIALDQYSPELKYSDVKGKNPFKDKRVRQAFYQAIDIAGIQRTVMRGASKPTALMVGPGINGFDDAMNTRLPFDPEAAKKLLADAGYPNGFEVALNCPNDRYVNDGAICQAVAASLARVGVKINLQAETKGTYFPKILRRDTSFYMLGWTPGTYDSHNALNALMRCVDGKGSGQFNLGSYCNPKVDELTLKIQSETDKPKRDALIKEAFKLHSDDIGHLPLHQQALAWGVASNVTLVQLADNFMPFRYMSVK